jgi:hypothetical protein
MARSTYGDEPNLKEKIPYLASEYDIVPHLALKDKIFSI